jgi:hypothetical protein
MASSSFLPGKPWPQMKKIAPCYRYDGSKVYYSGKQIHRY